MPKYMINPVLLVDDEVEMLDMLSAMLSEEGFDSVKVRGGEEGYNLLLERAREFGDGNPRISLVISDCKMPGWDGFQLLSKIYFDFLG